MTHPLLTPRYIVTNPWPGCSFKKGTILTEVAHLCSYGYEDDFGCKYITSIDNPELYPANLRPLEWHVYRELKDMPQYVKVDNQIEKVCKWELIDNLWHTKLYYQLYGADNLLPATEQEYNEYITKNQEA